MTGTDRNAANIAFGPWMAEKSHGSWCVYGADGKFVAATNGADDEKERLIARLIAAAPDLLAALKWAATVIRPGTDLREAIDAALSRAEGRHD